MDFSFSHQQEDQTEHLVTQGDDIGDLVPGSEAAGTCKASIASKPVDVGAGLGREVGEVSPLIVK